MFGRASISTIRLSLLFRCTSFCIAAGKAARVHAGQAPLILVFLGSIDLILSTKMLRAAPYPDHWRASVWLPKGELESCKINSVITQSTSVEASLPHHLKRRASAAACTCEGPTRYPCCRGMDLAPRFNTGLASAFWRMRTDPMISPAPIKPKGPPEGGALDRCGAG